ncbi:DUF7269 family protein [Halorussus salinus]|uniref:DUF7269 family protein n=1 Tax=Halorussus salinus TaxID=1364935 RepID=UPI0010927CE4|nr:hypothetical protein [Halorussus salinus]
MIPRLLGRASAKLQRPRSLAYIGGASLLLAVGVAFVPWLFPAAIFRPLSALVASPTSILVVAGAVGLLGVQAFRKSATSSADGEGEERTTHLTFPKEPERAHYDEYRTTGHEIDSVFDADPDETREFASRRRKAEGRIRRTAVRVLAEVERIGDEEAAERIAAGTWTDDPRAAAFLGGRRLAPLRVRIRDWASGERFERWATHAVEEIAAIDRDERLQVAREPASGGEDAGANWFETESDAFDADSGDFDTELDELEALDAELRESGEPGTDGERDAETGPEEVAR